MSSKQLPVVILLCVGVLCSHSDLAAFVKGASADQITNLWCATLRAELKGRNHRPLWVSTAGGGVLWLHARPDSQPKYYSNPPYKA